MTFFKQTTDETKATTPAKARTFEDVRASVQTSGALASDDLRSICGIASVEVGNGGSWDDYGNQVQRMLDGILGSGSYVLAVSLFQGAATTGIDWPDSNNLAPNAVGVILMVGSFPGLCEATTVTALVFTR